MRHFEYEITKYAADEFKPLIYFCTDQGECNQDATLSDQFDHLGDLLNSRGAEGWELVQVLVGNEGIVAFWKRPIDSTEKKE